DEYHFVPAAKELVLWNTNRNWEHPPVGKYLIAAGIALDQDRPFGWRWPGTTFGAWTVAGIHVLALVLFRSQSTAVFAALLTLFNQLLYVQSRTAMLDSFMTGFLIWALVGYSASWRTSTRRGLRWSRHAL